MLSNSVYRHLYTLPKMCGKNEIRIVKYRGKIKTFRNFNIHVIQNMIKEK